MRQLKNQSKIKIPKSWDELTCNQLLDLLDLENEKDDYNGYDFLFEQIAIICDMDSNDDIFYEITVEEINIILREMNWISQPFNHMANQYFELNGYKYKKIDFNAMLVAEWITFEYYITKNYKEYCREIIAASYRRIKTDDFGNEIMEEFDFDFNKRINEFDELTLNYLPIKEILDFRSSCFETFDLSNKLDDDDEEIIDEEIAEKIVDENKPQTYREKANEQNESVQERINKIYNWEKICMDLTGNNIKDSYELLKIPIVYLFRIITMKKNT